MRLVADRTLRSAVSRPASSGGDPPGIGFRCGRPGGRDSESARGSDPPDDRDGAARGPELCVCDLGWITTRAENLVGHHLRVLRDAGLARSRRDGKIVFYSLTDTGRGLVEAHLAVRQLT